MKEAANQLSFISLYTAYLCFLCRYKIMSYMNNAYLHSQCFLVRKRKWARERRDNSLSNLNWVLAVEGQQQPQSHPCVCQFDSFDFRNIISTIQSEVLTWEVEDLTPCRCCFKAYIHHCQPNSPSWSQMHFQTVHLEPSDSLKPSHEMATFVLLMHLGESRHSHLHWLYILSTFHIVPIDIIYII